MAKVNREFFIEQFREEASDHIQRITQKLFQLEEQPGEQKQLIEKLIQSQQARKTGVTEGRQFTEADFAGGPVGVAEVSGASQKLAEALNKATQDINSATAGLNTSTAYHE